MEVKICSFFLNHLQVEPRNVLLNQNIRTINVLLHFCPQVIVANRIFITCEEHCFVLVICVYKYFCLRNFEHLHLCVDKLGHDYLYRFGVRLYDYCPCDAKRSHENS